MSGASVAWTRRRLARPEEEERDVHHHARVLARDGEAELREALEHDLLGRLGLALGPMTLGLALAAGPSHREDEVVHAQHEARQACRGDKTEDTKCVAAPEQTQKHQRREICHASCF